jgi:multidrug transporter EmrE-like cation transporter
MSDGSARDWIINPMGMQKDFPVWGIFFTAVPAMGLCVLGFLDQNLTTLLINRKSSNLKKPPAYHLDLMMCGVFIYPICSLLGLPFTHAAPIRSLTHLISLTDFKDEVVGNTVMKKPDAVAEQRVSQLAIHALILASAFLSVVLKELPQAVLYGVFLFMGVSTISGNALFDRMSLWLIWDTTKYPSFPFIQGIETKKLHMYTFIQFLCLVVLYVLKSVKAIAVVFPFFLIVICFVRMFLSRMFTPQELLTLDGPSALLQAPKEEQEGTKITEDTAVVRHGHTLEDLKKNYVPEAEPDQRSKTIMML